MMDTIAQVIGMNPEVLMQFIVYGLWANFLSFFVVAISTFIKCSPLSQDDIGHIKFFLLVRRTEIKKNRPIVLLASTLLILLPFYQLWISMVIIYYYFTVPGGVGVLRAVRRADQFAIVKLIVYHPLPENDK